VRLVAGAGFFGVLSNDAAFGRGASTIDFRKAAGQDNLQRHTRWSAELDLGRRHTCVFLIQPLSMEAGALRAARGRSRLGHDALGQMRRGVGPCVRGKCHLSEAE
jgi:hypothetical protein